MFIDIHAHINDEKLINDIDNVLLRAKEAGVEKIVCVGADYESSKTAVELADKYQNVYATVGIHPNECFEFDKKMGQLIVDSAKNKKVVAIGEIGLDFYDLDYQINEAKQRNPKLEITTKEQFIAKQKEIFIEQIELANRVGLPIMIHMREATGETLQILEDAKKEGLIKNGGLLHCYNGSLETTKRVFELDFYISLGGALTFKNSKTMPEIIKQIGIDRVCLETDCPYLSPEPFRGKINEPKNVVLVAEKLATITMKGLNEIEKTTTENCYAVFPRLKND
jgi:TatD DNase family protein